MLQHISSEVTVITVTKHLKNTKMLLKMYVEAYKTF